MAGMDTMSYGDEIRAFRHLFDRHGEGFSLAGVDVRQLHFVSRNVSVLPPGRKTRPSAAASPPSAAGREGDEELAELLAVDDRAVVENMSFSYPIFLPRGRRRAGGAVILLHGLNEKSWHKYLPWARALCTGTGKAVILFPLAFHMNRAPRLWSSPRSMIRLARRRQGACSSLAGSSFVNAALSTRLQHAPAKFFWSGLVSYLDVLQLVRQIRCGEHPCVAAGAGCDLFGYSIGALLAEILLMSDPAGLFREARAFLFCGGATLDRLRPVSRMILDSRAGSSLRRFYGSGFGREVTRDSSLSRVFTRLEEAGACFSSFLGGGRDRLREKRLRQISARISALALKRDSVIPGSEVTATLKGARRDIPVTVEVLDFPYAYSHEDPFPAAAGAAAGVDSCFRQVFRFAAGCLA
jgi:hypothetical protein